MMLPVKPSVGLYRKRGHTVHLKTVEITLSFSSLFLSPHARPSFPTSFSYILKLTQWRSNLPPPSTFVFTLQSGGKKNGNENLFGRGLRPVTIVSSWTRNKTTYNKIPKLVQGGADPYRVPSYAMI